MSWTVTIYRRDSRTKVVYENVKHAWWENDNYCIAQFTAAGFSSTSGTGDGTHHYWTWPRELISHVEEEPHHAE